SSSLKSHSTSRRRFPSQNIAADLYRDVSSSSSLLLLLRNLPSTSAVTKAICDSPGVAAANMRPHRSTGGLGVCCERFVLCCGTLGLGERAKLSGPIVRGRHAGVALEQLVESGQIRKPDGHPHFGDPGLRASEQGLGPLESNPQQIRA